MDVYIVIWTDIKWDIGTQPCIQRERLASYLWYLTCNGFLPQKYWNTQSTDFRDCTWRLHFVYKWKFLENIRYPQDILLITPMITSRYPHSIPKISPTWAKYISPRYPHDIPKILHKISQDIFKIAPRYLQDIPKVSSWYHRYGLLWSGLYWRV